MPPKENKNKKAKKNSSSKRKEQIEEKKSARLEELIRQRDEATQARIEKLSVEQMKSLIGGMMKRNPTFVFYVMEETERENDKLKTTVESLKWCTCHNCREMLTLAENVCCNGNSETCISKHPNFRYLSWNPWF